MRATSQARLTPRWQGPCLKGPSCSIHIALTCTAIPQRAVAEASETPGAFAALRPTPWAQATSQFERGFCKELYGISPQYPPPGAGFRRFGLTQGEDRHGGQERAGAAAALPTCEQGVRVRVTQALPWPRAHGSSPRHSTVRQAGPTPFGARGTCRDPWAARAGDSPECRSERRMAWHDAARMPPAYGLALQACSSKAERCYYMAEVGGSIPSAPTSSARAATVRARRLPGGPSGRFLRPAGRTPCSERAK